MKFMNMKRFGSVVMAGALALSLTVPAFAGSTQPDHSTVITGGYTEIPIAVTVPTTGTANINPYGLPVTLTKSNDSTVNIVGQQITHEVLAVRNNGDVALDMDVKSFQVLPKGEVSVAATADADKQIKVELQVAGLNDAKYALAPDNDSLGDALIDAFAADSTWTGAKSVAAPTASANATSVTTPGTIAKAAALGAATVADGAVTAYGNSSIALFRLKGTLAADPKTGTTENPWEAADGFVATVVFKFAPVSAGDAAVTVGIASGTATATFNAGTSGLTVAKYEWVSSDETVATVVADTGTTNTSAVTTVGTGAGRTSTITVTATLSNGSTITGNATFTTT